MTGKDWDNFFKRKCVLLIESPKEYSKFAQEAIKRNPTLVWNGGRELDKFKIKHHLYPICINMHKTYNAILYDKSDYYERDGYTILKYENSNEANKLLSWIEGGLNGVL